MQSIALWAWGVLAGLVALVGLLMAGKADDGGFELAGYLFMLFGALFVISLIRRYGPGGPGE